MGFQDVEKVLLHEFQSTTFHIMHLLFFVYFYTYFL